MLNSAPGAAAGPYRIIMLAALPQEVRPFLRRLHARRRRGLPWPAWEFALGRVRGLLALSGMGAGPAGEAAAQLLAQFRPHLLISLGFGGALNPELQPGDLVLGAAFGRYEPRTQALEYLTPAPAPPLALPGLLDRLAAAGWRAFLGTFITTPWIIHKGGQGAALLHLPVPVLDLESAAAAEAAWDAALPFLGLRAITDGFDEELPDFLVPAEGAPGPVGLLEALGWLAADPRRLKDLLHLRRRSRLAAARLAAGLMVLLPLLEKQGNLSEGNSL
jgi:adenosylhomocysteine nucleosidase